MAKELDLYGGNNPANDKDARKNGVTQTTGQVKALNTGHTETSLKKKLRKEVDDAWSGNHGLLGDLFTIFGNILKTGGRLIGSAIAGVGELFGGVIEGVQSFIGNIANAITAPKAGFEVITGAVDERLGPIDTAITRSGDRMTELSGKVDDALKKQDQITEETEAVNKRVDGYVQTAEEERERLDAYERQRKQDVLELTIKADKGIADAKKATEDLANAEALIRAEMSDTLRKAESAQKSADGKNTIYYGSKTPKSPKNGDTWFKQVTGGTQTLVFQDGKWVNTFDSAKADADLKAAREAVAQAEKNVATLKNETLPALDKDIEKLRGELALESDARSKALEEATQNMAKTKADLEENLAASATRIATAEQNLAKAEASVKDIVDKQLPAIRNTTSGLSSKLASEQAEREKAISNLNSSLTRAKSDLNGSLSTLQTNLDAAEKKLQNSIDTKATQATLDSVKKSLEKSLSDNEAALTTARGELDELNLTRPGNIFPDPFFGHKCWGGRRQNPGLKIDANGTTTGAYFANNRADAQTGVQFEPGAHYLLTADVEFSGDVTEILVRVTGTKDTTTGGVGTYTVAKISKAETSGVVDDIGAVTFKAPVSLRSGSTTLGFLVSSSSKSGYATLNNVRLVRAADNSLVVDGAITAAKVQAGAIDTGHLTANAVTSDKIKAGAIVAGKLSANAVTAENLQANAVTAGKIAANAISARELAADSVTATQIKAGEVKAGALAANSVTALNIVAGTITANELGANSVTTKQLTANSVNASALQANSVKADHLVANQITGDKLKANAITSREVKANSIMAEHMVIGGPANLIANGSFTEGKEPWSDELTVRTISKSQALPPGDRYAITKAGQGSLNAHTGNQWFTVTPEGLYAFEIWLWADKPGSRFYLELRDQYGAHAGKALRDKVNSGDVDAGSGSYLMTNVSVRTGWNKYSTVYQVGKNTTRAQLGTFYFNHPNGSEQNAQIAFAGISLRPMADADLIVDGAILSQHIKAGTITGDRLAANTINTRELAADAVTAKQLDADAVTARAIKSGEITGDKIKANTITGNQILANSITANELQIRPGNMFPDPDFQDPCWGTSGAVYAHPNNGGELRFFPDGVQHGLYYQPAGYKDRSFMLEEGAQYRITATTWASTSALSKAKIDIYTRYYKPDGKVGVQFVGSLPVDGSGRSTPSCVITMPSDMKDGLCTLGFFINPPWNGGQISMWNVQMVRAADASLIVDGAILATHIKAGEITGDRLKADTITSKQLATGAVKAVNIESGAITTKQLAANTLHSDNFTFGTGWITNAMIKNAEIEASKIKSIDASKITTGTMSGKRIDADSITVRQLRANSIIPIGGSLIHHEPPPEDDTKPPEPIWWQTCDKELPENYSGWPRPEGNPWRMSSGAQGKHEAPSVPKRLVKVKPGQKYRLQFWCRSTRADTKMFIEMRDQNGKHAVKSGTVTGTVNTGNYQTANEAKQPWPVTDFTNSKVGSYLVNNFTLPTSITKVTSTIEFNEGVEYVYLDHFYFNHPNGTEQANQWLAGLSLELDIPKQEDVDNAQNAAIEANTAAIKVLGRVDPGSSLIGYIQPSEADLKNPKKTVDWTIPEWTVAANKSGTDSKQGKWWGYQGSSAPREAKPTYRPVNSSIPYRMMMNASGTGIFSIAVGSSKRSTNIIKSAKVFAGWDENGKKVYNPVSHGGVTPVNGMSMPGSSVWGVIDVIIEFQPDITDAGIDSFFWNQSGTTGLQRVANLEFGPYAPTQSEIDFAQDSAISGLKTASELNVKFQNEQKRINRAMEAQMWTHQDMLELLDIRTPKSYGWGTRVYRVGAKNTPNPYYGNKTHGYYVNTDYFERWEYPDEKEVYIAARGTWTGSMDVEINWDNGALDNWNVPIEKNQRIYRFTGGAWHIKMRSISVAIYPRSLNRTAKIGLYDGGKGAPWTGDFDRPGKHWYNATDINGLFRQAYQQSIRLKNTVTCDREVWYRDENNQRQKIPAGQPIYSQQLYPEDQDLTTVWYTFYEVDEQVPDTVGNGGYTVPDVRPTGSAETIAAKER